MLSLTAKKNTDAALINAPGQSCFNYHTDVPQPFITSTRNKGGDFAKRIKSAPAILSKTKEKTDCNAILLPETADVPVLGHSGSEVSLFTLQENGY